MAGDGTTPATVLARAIYENGQKLVVAGHNSTWIKRGIDKAVARVVDTLETMVIPTQNQKDIAQVGTISPSNDEAIG